MQTQGNLILFNILINGNHCTPVIISHVDCGSEVVYMQVLVQYMKLKNLQLNTFSYSPKDHQKQVKQTPHQSQVLVDICPVKKLLDPL